MSVTTDIFGLWRRPAAIFRPKLAAGPREDRAIAVLMAACLLIFVAQWPRLSREAHLTRQAAEATGRPLAEIPDLQALIGANLFALLFIAPLVFYILAGLTALIARVFGFALPGWSARLALFWALLASAPLFLLQGMVAGFVGPGTGATLLGILILLAFLWLWFRLVREAVRQ